MPEPDDVERLVGEIESLPPFHFCNKCGAMYHGGSPLHPGCSYWAAESDPRPKRLARIVRELLAEHQTGPCVSEALPLDLSCAMAWSETPSLWCDPCRARALRERLCRIARGEA